MPTILRNKTATIEIDFNVNLQHIVTKGSFDVTILDGTDGATTVKYVWLLFRRAGQIKDNIRLDWRDVTPAVESAEELRDLLLAYNVPPALITGQKPDGTFDEVELTESANFKVSMQEFDQDYFNRTPLPTKIQANDSSSIDAFGRWRVSNPYTLFDSKQLHDKQPLFWDEIIGGVATSTHNPVNACTEMEVTASASDYVIRQTKQRFNYQPGKSQLVNMTFYAPQSGFSTKRIGIFDGTGVDYLTPNNGIFLQVDGNVSLNICKNGTITETVNQADWNVDALDGTGVSGITLDLDAAHILVIDYEWLSIGRVRVGFMIGGFTHYVHKFNHANDPSFTSAYISTPNLPLRYSIEANGQGIDQLDHICSSVMSEGGLDETGVLRSVNTGTTHIDAATVNTKYAILGIRLKSTHIDITVLPEFISMIEETGAAFKWELLLNPTVNGTFTYADVDNSAIQRAQGAGATITADGVIIDSGFVSAAGAGGGSGGSSKISTSLRIGSKIDGTQDVIVLAGTPLTANADIQGSLTFRELL